MSSITSFLASNLSSPLYLGGALPLRRAVSSNMFIMGRLCLRPTSKSLKSCAGVIFTAPVPFSGSLYSSAIIGMGRSARGSTAFFPTRCLYRGSSGCTATAVSPSIVSGLVVATVMNSALPSIGYLKCQKCPETSRWSTSRSEIAVHSLGSQLTSLLSL